MRRIVAFGFRKPRMAASWRDHQRRRILRPPWSMARKVRARWTSSFCHAPSAHWCPEACVMDSALAIHRLHFAFTITFHYLFPQLTMGLGLLIVVLKSLALWKRDESYGQAARFWARIFAINFAMGVVTGIPMEFQFGTNWAKFSQAAGGIIGQTLAMEGVFSFFLESTFLGLFLFGEKRLGQTGHWFAASMVFLGSWLSGFLIVATDAWMQHPVGYTVAPGGEIVLNSFWALIFNPWVGWQYLHNMIGAVITACFVMAAVGSFYLLTGKHDSYGRTFVH